MTHLPELAVLIAFIVLMWALFRVVMK